MKFIAAASSIALLLLLKDTVSGFSIYSNAGPRLSASPTTLLHVATSEEGATMGSNDDSIPTNEDQSTKAVVEQVPPPSPSLSSSSSNEGKEVDVDMKIPVVERLSESYVTSVKTNEKVNVSSFLQSGKDKSLLVFGTYAADFNAIEYVQRLRYYLPQIQAKGVDKIGLILNCDADAAKKVVSMLDLDTDATSSDAVVELFIDPLGEAGRKFGVGRGWRPDDEEMSPYVKLFGMLWGLGAWATLPAVIGGYIGNPFFGQPWIEDALAVGQRKGRWPSALDLNEETGEVKVNNFKTLPVVGEWERRPLELATLRLQNMVDVSIKNWEDLSPNEESLKAGVLTQLGGCVIVDSKSGEEVARWRDPGICAVANFENLLEKF